MFEIPEGSQVRIFPKGSDPQDSFNSNFVTHTTRSMRLFDKHEVVFDPQGSLGRGRYKGSPTHYGFELVDTGTRWDGSIVIAHISVLKYDGVWMCA